jgi:hypothetical protein
MHMGYRHNRHSEHNNDSFRRIDTAEKAYLIGLIASDGTIGEQKSNIIIELKIEDRELLEKIPPLIGGYAKEVTRKSGYEAYYWRVTSSRMVADLNRLGIPSGKKGGRNAQYWVINIDLIPPEFHRDFWRGMVDGDGSLMPYISKNRSRRGGHSRMELKGTESNVELFSNTIREMFGSSAKPQRTHASWVFVSGGDQLCRKVATWLYKDASISLARKQKLAEIMMQKEAIHRKFDYMGKEKILEMKRKHGTWERVASELGLSGTGIDNTRKRLGIDMRISKHEFNLNEIFELYDQLGTWRKVAEELEVRPETLYKIRKRLQEEEE